MSSNCMAFTLAHLSDPHLAPLPRLQARDYFSKRLFGFLNWKRGRNAIHRAGILQHLVADMKAQMPDHVAITGDLTNLGLAAEFETARAWLHTMAPVEKLTVIPGNHDAYVPGALEKGLKFFSDWLPPGMQHADGFPFVHERGFVAMVGLSTSIATLPFSATGRVGKAQLERLKLLLKKLGQQKKFRIVLLHHALQVPRRKFSKRLLDSDALQAVLAECGAELVLHGHLHYPVYHQIPGPAAPIHVFGVSAASADPAVARWPAGYALYRIEEQEKGWRVHFERRAIGIGGSLQQTQEMALAIPVAPA